MSGKPFLLVQTPRAGITKSRFRLLASIGSGLTEKAAVELISAAARTAGDTAEGSDYVAVTARNVPQSVGGRTGDETIVLGGLNPSSVVISAVLLYLRTRLDSDLPALLGRIDWSRQEGVLIEREELTQWRDEVLSVARARMNRPRWWQKW